MKRRGLKKWSSLFLALSVLMSFAIPASAQSMSTEWSKVFKSLEVTQNNMKKDYDESKSELSKLISSILEKPYCQEVNAELLGVWNNSHDTSKEYGFQGVGLGLSRKYDKNAGAELIDGSFYKNRNAFFNLTAFLSPHLVAVGSKELLGSSLYGINPATLEEDIKQSVFAEIVKSEMDEKEFKTNIDSVKSHINSYISQSQKEWYKKITKAFLNCFIPDKESLIKNQIQKTNTTTVIIQKTSVACDEYSIKLSKDWLHNYIDQSAEKLKNNTEIQSLIKEQFREAGLSEMADEINEEMRNSIDDAAQEFKDTYNEDINVKLYINQEDELVKLVFETTANDVADESSEKINVCMEITIGDGNLLTNGFTAALKASQPSTKEETAMKFEMNREQTEGKEAMSCKLSADAENQNLFTLKLYSGYDLKKTNDNVSIEVSMKADSEACNIKGSGNLLMDKEQSAVSLQVDDLTITLNDKYNKTVVKLKGDLSCKQIDANEVNVNGKDVKMILKMSQNELQALGEQLDANQLKLEEKLDKLFSPQTTYDKK